MPRASFERAVTRLAALSDIGLSGLLLIAAIILFTLALLPGHRFLKAVVAAYVYLP